MTLHRLTNKEPKWGGLLTNMRDVHRLSEEETQLCQECHILPSCLCTTKEQVLSKQKKVFYTLFDMHTVSSLDMLHAQRLFEFLADDGEHGVVQIVRRTFDGDRQPAAHGAQHQHRRRMAQKEGAEQNCRCDLCLPNRDEGALIGERRG